MSIYLMILIIIVFYLLSGILMGFVRGFFKSLIRILLLMVGFVGAFLLFKPVLNLLLNLEINGKTFETLLIDLAPNATEFIDILMPLFTIILQLVIFVVLSFIFEPLSYAIYKCITAIFKKKDTDEDKSKHRISGAIVGLLQGLIMIYMLLVPLTSVSLELPKIITIDKDAEISEKNKELIDGLEVYNESKISEIFIKIGEPLNSYLTTTKNEYGEDVTLSGQLDGVIAAINLADEFSNIAEIDFSSGLTQENIDKLSSAFENMDNIKDTLDDESSEALNNIIKAIASDYIEDINISDVDLSSEGELISDIYTYQETGSVADPEKLVNDLADSIILFEVITASNVNIELDDSELEVVSEAINNLDNADDEKINELKALFGIN